MRSKRCGTTTRIVFVNSIDNHAVCWLTDIRYSYIGVVEIYETEASAKSASVILFHWYGEHFNGKYGEPPKLQLRAQEVVRSSSRPRTMKDASDRQAPALFPIRILTSWRAGNLAYLSKRSQYWPETASLQFKWLTIRAFLAANRCISQRRLTGHISIYRLAR